jgi:ribosomal protein L24
VQVIAGSDKGVVGKVVSVNTKRGEILVEGVNIKVRRRWTGFFLEKQGASNLPAWMAWAGLPAGLDVLPAASSCSSGAGAHGSAQPEPASDALHPAPHHHSPLQTKHVKPAQQGEQGQILKKEFPVHHSNVAVYSTTQQVTSRVGIK